MRTHNHKGKYEPDEPAACEPELSCEPDGLLALEPVLKESEFNDLDESPEPESPMEADESHGVTVVCPVESPCATPGAGVTVPCSPVGAASDAARDAVDAADAAVDAVDAVDAEALPVQTGWSAQRP